ncbi:MAG TPA: hypothetical protein VIH76_03835, partial [Candidatus Acidoferrales bacterium]
MSTLPNAHDSHLLSPANSPAETIAKLHVRSSGNSFSHLHGPEGAATNSELTSDRAARRNGHSQARPSTNKPLKVIKFGGTSVGDAVCIARVMEIIRTTALDSDLVVVVSAMSGVT